MFPTFPFGLFGGVSAVALSITTNQSNYDAFTAAGSPTGRVDVAINISSGVIIKSTSTANPAIDLTGFAAGSTVTIVNEGYIVGKGGAGGAGAGADSIDPGHTGDNGGDGGNAIDADANVDLTITNASGYIWGGGGGGGGGDGSATNQAGGGGGGGGAGEGVGGLGGPGDLGSDGSDGTDGSLAPTDTAGSGGANGVPGGTSGANGGAYGVAGSNAASATGGAAGKAIDLNGASVTWVSGSGSPNVKGAVS